jgi:hypothetical protein
MMARRFVRKSAVGCVATLAVGLQSSVAGASSGQVPRSVVEAQAAKVLAKETGQKLPTVKCPGDLAAEVGAHINCTLTPHGTKLKYPVRVTVNGVRNGTAHFSVQVGQAPGQANKAKFCHDNAIIEAATSMAQTKAQLLAAFAANQNTILDFQGTAPSKVAADAGTLAQAVRVAVKAGNISGLNKKAFVSAGLAVDRFCGVVSGGSSVGATSTTGV